MGRLEKVREVYDLKFAELKSPENWRNTLKGISKYYKFNFVEAILIHSQADNVTVMAEMKNWNKFGRYIKMGEHGIAVFTARTDTKLKYLFDIGQTKGKPIERAWNIRESKQQRERLINRYNAKYGTDFAKASEVVKDIYSEVMESIKQDIEREIEVYKPEKADTIKKFIADSALCLILSRCGFKIPDDKLDFSAVSEIIPDGMLVAAGNLSMKAAHEALMEIENAIRRNDYEQQIQNQGHRLGVRGEGRDILSQVGGTDRQGAAEHYGKESSGYAERNESHSLGYGEHERSLRQDMGGDSGESDRQGDGSNGDHEEKSSDGAEGEGSEGNGDPNRSGAAGERADDGIGDTAENSGNDPSPLVGRGSVAAPVNDTEQNNNEESSENDDSFSFPDIPYNSAIVKIEWSESAELQDGEIFSFEEINRRLAALDDEQRINREREDWHSWYDKTKFTLYAKNNGSEETYIGRYDIGDGDGTLLHHIELCSGEEASELISFLKGLEQQAAKPQTLGEDNTEVIEGVIEGEQQYFIQENEAENISDRSVNSLTAIRVGDFYEFLGNDAEIAAEKLGLTLTTRNGEPMVGVPSHALDQYRDQLNNAGFNVTFVESAEEIYSEKIHNAFERLKENHNFSSETAGFLDKVEKQIIINKFDSFDPENITTPLFQRSYGGIERINDVLFKGELTAVINEVNTYIGQETEERQRIENFRQFAKEQDVPFSEKYYNEAEEFDPYAADGSMSFEDFRKMGLLNSLAKNTPVNFHLSEGETIDYSKGEKAKFRDNVTAIRTLKEIEKEKRLATANEQQILSKYTGWGGLSKAFDKSAANWQKEYIELKALLSEEEYDAAFNSTLTAYYTDTELVRPIYRALERFGFKGGEVLDPAMGTGNFFSVIPSEMAQNSHLYGIELDKITGRIAKLLYPNADIKIQGFEYSNFEDGTFDVAVGNVPFENYRVSDNAYEDEYVLHDYFFIKTLDKLKPGGIAAFITSSGTLDKFNTSARIDIANRAELIGAVRLPGGKDGAFKAIAGTEATTDIIFLQKRERPESFMSYNMPQWAGSPTSIYNKENHYLGTVNKYFSQHPEMILGEIKRVSGPHGFTVQCLPKEGTDLYEELEKALSTLQCEFTAKPTEITEESIEDIEEENRITAADNAENYCFYVDESDRLYYRENEYMTLFEAKSAKDERAIKAMCGLCGCVKKVIDVQLTSSGEDQLKEAQKNLEQEYDKFVKSYGYLNKAENIRLFRTDMRSSLLLSLEQETDETENTGVYEKADIFTKATISPSKTVEIADSPQEALAISLNLKNAVNIQYMASLCDETEEKVISDLGDLIYQNPQKYTGSPNSGWETAEEYLSGYVKDKLQTAMMFAEQYPELFERNVTALREHQPADIPISDIDFSVGAVYIPDDMYRDFMYEIFNTSPWCRSTNGYHIGSSIEVEYSSLLNLWKITNKGLENNQKNLKISEVYGTDRINAYEIMECSLNQKRVTIKDPVEYRNQKGEKAIKYVVNIKETQIARDRQTKIETAFKDWVLKDSERVERIERIYNERFNNIVVRKYDGSHIKIPGLNPLIELRPHQLNAVARIASGNNVMLAHEVGAGKTAAMAAAGVYMRSIGAVKKPLYIVPKPIVAQWGREFARFFPLAKVLVTDEKDFEMKNRRKFLSKIATGDFDAVIMSHNQFEKIPLSLERQERIFNEKKMQLMEAKEKARASDGKKAFSVKQYASAIKALDKKLTKLRAEFKKDSFITFEQLGCDYLFADEAHIYKNLYTATKHSNVAGINSNADSQRAFDMDMKASYLQEINDGGGITFATGTPISNSISECYVFQHFLQSPMLKKEGINSFDEWVSVFGNISLALEVKPTGNGWRMRERFSEFKNLPELCNMQSQCFDLVKTKDIKGISLPKIAGGKPEIVVCEQSADQAAQVAEGMERAQKIEEKKLSTKDDNMLAVCSFMSKVSLDPRINNPEAEDWDGLKVNECAKSIIDIHKQYPNSAQVVFCDLSTPNGEGFNVYQALKDRLLKSGEFKPEEIAFVHDANNDKQRIKMFDKVNSAQIKVIIGSTSKLGTGVNMQKKLIAAHHLDAPYVPKDIEQRNGRIVRQGNENSEVIIRCYSTKGTFDSYRWQLLEKKQQLIAQVLSGKPPARSCKDIDETALTFAEMKAATADNPLIAEKMQVDNEVDRLKLLESDWISQQSRYKLDFEKYFPSVIQKQNDLIEKLDQDLKLLEANPIPKDSFVMEVNGISYAERTEAGNALVVEYNKYLGTDEWRNSEPSKSVGNFRGFDISFYHTTQSSTVRLMGASGFIYESDFTLSAVGTCIKIENLVGGISGRKQAALSGIKEAEKGIEAAKAQYGKPFEYAEELNNLLLKQADINSKLEFGQEQEEIIDEEWEGDETEV